MKPKCDLLGVTPSFTALSAYVLIEAVTQGRDGT
jgi:hypothetical protein